MKFLEKISSAWTKAGSTFRKPAQRAFDSLHHLMEHEDESGKETTDNIICLLKAVLIADGNISENEIDELRTYLCKSFNNEQAERIIKKLDSGKSSDSAPGKAAKELAELPEEQKLSIITALVEAAWSDHDYSSVQKKTIEEICVNLKFSNDDLESIENDVSQRQEKRKKIIKSGAGIIAALFIISIFILTATFLKSVLFGLILAYIFLPLEYWFEKKFFKNRIIQAVGSFFEKLSAPVKKMTSRISSSGNEEESSEDLDKKRKDSEIRKASAATVLTGVILFTAASLFILLVSFHYVAGIGNSVKGWADRKMAESNLQSATQEQTKDVKNKVENVTDSSPPTAKTSDQATKSAVPSKVSDSTATDSPVADEEKELSITKKGKKILASLENKLESFRPAVENLPFVKETIDAVKEYLSNKENRRNLINVMIKKSGGVFSFTAGFISSFASLLLNLVLTVFFFFLFINKMAEYRSDGGSLTAPGKYIIKSVYSTKWMPEAGEETLDEARKILDNVFFKLKTWVKGYMSIIVIESVFYISTFMLLGVPYGAILGFVAGLTILLPFLGPAASCILTCVVCLAFGTGMTTVFGVIIMYLIMSGTLEQIIIYPYYVGNSIGLSTFETIVIVLLGGLFAGISGMIFAVPAASVLKYLIPKIYSCWGAHKATE